MPTPYATQTDPNASNEKTGPQQSSTPAGQKPSSTPNRDPDREAAMAGLGVAKDMGKRQAEIEDATLMKQGEANAVGTHPVDLLKGGNTDYASKVRRGGRV